MTYFILAVFKDMLNNLNRTDPTWTRRITGSGVICVKNINFASRPYMYFSEQGNVDDDGTFITIFFVSFNLQSCCLMQSAVCSLRSAACGLRSAVCSLQSAVFGLQSAVFGLRSAVCSLQMSYTGCR